MVSSTAQEAKRSRLRPERAAPMARTLVAHERSVAFLCALVAAFVAFGPRVQGGGLTADDWALYADVKFPTALGFHSSLGALGSSAGSRIGAPLYWLASFSLFGSHTRLYTALAALLAVVMAFSIYVLLRELRFTIAESLAMMLLTIAAPAVATVRFWFTPSGSQISLTLFFFGLTLALRAFSTTGKRRTRMHAASWLLYALSACYAEVALSLIGVSILVYLTRARPVASLRRWAFDMIVVVGGYLATLSYVSAEAGFVKLPKSMWGEHARLIGDQALTIFTRMLDPFAGGSRQLELVGLGLVAVASLLLFRSPRTSASFRRSFRRWGFTLFVCLVAVVASYSVFIPAILYYEPLGPGLPSHINIVAAAPLAVGVFAVLMFTRAVIAELLDRLRADSGRFAALLVAAWFAVTFVDGLRDVRNNGRVWAHAAGLDRRVLDALTTDLPQPVHGSTTYTFGEAGAAAPGLPVFFSSFELTNAVKIAYGRGDLAAYPVVTDDDTVNCAPRGITVVSGSSPLNLPSPYGRSYFIDLPTGRQQRIDSMKACTAALSTFHAGPYSAPTTLEWAQ